MIHTTRADFLIVHESRQNDIHDQTRFHPTQYFELGAPTSQTQSFVFRRKVQGIPRVRASCICKSHFSEDVTRLRISADKQLVRSQLSSCSTPMAASGVTFKRSASLISRVSIGRLRSRASLHFGYGHHFLFDSIIRKVVSGHSRR